MPEGGAGPKVWGGIAARANAPGHIVGSDRNGGDTMPRITIHLDDATQALVEQAAKARGLSKSRWVAGIIRKHAAHEWPQDCLALAGRFADFPLRDAEGAKAMTVDVPRLGF